MHKFSSARGLDADDPEADGETDLLRFPEEHFSVGCLCNKGEISPADLTKRIADKNFQFRKTA